MIHSPSFPQGASPKRSPMVKNLLVCLSVCRLQVRRLREYALGFWSSLASIPFLMVVTYFVWRVAFGNRSTVNGYTFSEIISYYFLLRLVSLVIGQAGAVAWNVWQDVNGGNLANYLARPLNYGLMSLGKCAGPALVYLAAGMVTYGASAVALDLPVALSPARVVFFGVSVFGGFVMMYLTQFIVAETTFWIGRIDSLRDLVYEVYAFLSGSIIPNDFLPTVLRRIADASPLKFMYYVPVSATLGRIDIAEFPGLLVSLLLWTAGLTVVSWFLWRRGVRRFEAQGG